MSADTNQQLPQGSGEGGGFAQFFSGTSFNSTLNSQHPQPSPFQREAAPTHEAPTTATEEADIEYCSDSECDGYHHGKCRRYSNGPARMVAGVRHTQGRKPKRESTCVNCGLLGHRLRHCCKAAPDGFLHGCPRCDLMTHDFDSCNHPNKNTKEQLLFSGWHRQGRCPLKTARNPRYEPGFDNILVKPWTASFARANAHKWRDHKHERNVEDEVLEHDPAWEHPENIPDCELAWQYRNGRAPSPDMSVTNRRRPAPYPRTQRDLPPPARPPPATLPAMQSVQQQTLELLMKSQEQIHETTRMAMQLVSANADKAISVNAARDNLQIEAAQRRDDRLLDILGDGWRQFPRAGPTPEPSSQNKRKREADEEHTDSAPITALGSYSRRNANPQ